MGTEKKLTMGDIIATCPAYMRQNIAQSAALTRPLVEEYIAGGYHDIWIVACGSSANGSWCARQFMRRYLGCEVKIVNPFTFVTCEHDLGPGDMVVTVSQSGYSLNALEAVAAVKALGRRAIGLTGDLDSDLARQCDVAANYGVGRETVAYVTRGVTTLALFFMLFAVEAAERLGRTANGRSQGTAAARRGCQRGGAAGLAGIPARALPGAFRHDQCLCVRGGRQHGHGNGGRAQIWRDAQRAHRRL